MTPSRVAFMGWLLKQEGKPYLWAAKGELNPLAHAECFDCSGLITCGMVEVGWPRICARIECADGKDWLGFHNAQRLFDHFEPLGPGATPRAMDLAFYGSSPRNVDHVMVLWGDGQVFGASGGNRHSIDPVDTLRRGQKVRFRPSVTYRPDLIAIRSLPF